MCRSPSAYLHAVGSAGHRRVDVCLLQGSHVALATFLGDEARAPRCSRSVQRLGKGAPIVQLYRRRVHVDGQNCSFLPTRDCHNAMWHPVIPSELPTAIADRLSPARVRRTLMAAGPVKLHHWCALPETLHRPRATRRPRLIAKESSERDVAPLLKQTPR